MVNIIDVHYKQFPRTCIVKHIEKNYITPEAKPTEKALNSIYYHNLFTDEIEQKNYTKKFFNIYNFENHVLKFINSSKELNIFDFYYHDIKSIAKMYIFIADFEINVAFNNDCSSELFFSNIANVISDEKLNSSASVYKSHELVIEVTGNPLNKDYVIERLNSLRIFFDIVHYEKDYNFITKYINNIIKLAPLLSCKPEDYIKLDNENKKIYNTFNELYTKYNGQYDKSHYSNILAKLDNNKQRIQEILEMKITSNNHSKMLHDIFDEDI